MSEQSITCPRCGAKSHNASDVREGYCGHCHDWTKAPISYDRAVLLHVLVYHWPTKTSGCGGCGEVALGASFPDHIADVYEQSMVARA